MTTLTISDLTRMDGSTLMNPNIPVSATYFPTSVAVGNYAADLHGCKSPATLENDLGETSVTGWVFTRYQIPFNALIPQTIDGFIAAEKKYQSVSPREWFCAGTADNHRYRASSGRHCGTCGA